MIYQHTKIGKFINRENRFIAYVEVEGKVERVHVPNTGRCAELFLPGVSVLLREAEPGSKRKTPYSIVHVEKAGRWINIDSQAPNHLVGEFLDYHQEEYGIFQIQKEVKFGKSRFDFAFTIDGKPALLEVKGVTLEKEGHSYFPDAPTLRGKKHVRELAKYAATGNPAYVFFVIQMQGVHTFSPNYPMDLEFAEALLEAKDMGVNLIAMDIRIHENEMEIHKPVPIFLGRDIGARVATSDDVDGITTILQEGIESLKRDGVNQWQGKESPNREEVLSSVDAGTSYVFLEDETILATAILQPGIEPTYAKIEGAWQSNRPYTTIHRFAVSKGAKGKGVGKRALQRMVDISYSKGFSSIRIDTHRENQKMRRLIESMNFTYCGIIVVKDGTERLAYERIL